MPESTREKLLNIALDLYTTKGFHGTSMRDVARAADVAVSGIYNHFANKETMFVAVLQAWHPFVRMQPLLMESEGETVRELLHDTLHRLAHEYHKNPRIFNLFFIEIIEFDGQHLPDLFEELQPSVAEWMARVQATQGQLRAKSPQELFQWLMTVLFAYFTQNHIMRGQVDVDAMAALYLNGMVIE